MWSAILGVFVVSMVLVSSAATNQDIAFIRSSDWYTPFAAADTVDVDSLLLHIDIQRADTDSVYTALVDSALTSRSIPRMGVGRLNLIDSLYAALVISGDTLRTARYLRERRRRSEIATPFPEKKRPLRPDIGRYWQHQIRFDTTALSYSAKVLVGQQVVRHPVELDFAEYRTARRDRDLDKNWRELITENTRNRQQRRQGGLGFNIVVPGGRQSAFTTIFGTSDINLSVSGSADIKAGFDYRKSDQQVAISGKASQLDPEFKQDLSLGINGTVGDKLRVNVQYDSRNEFDYQNNLKLEYTGYEDEIVQKIEAGNVFLQTGSTLIRGGQSLFGIKSEFQVGGVHLTTVMSQQEGQANSLNIEGGSEQTEYDLRPTDYVENMHFFLGYYFRNRWEDALSDPPTIRVANGFTGITEIEVWKLMPTRPEEENVRQAVAVVDLAEEPQILEEADEYSSAVLPGSNRDQYDDSPGGELDTELRNGQAAPASYLEAKGLASSDFQIGKFKRLERGRDYDIDETLGYISLTTPLQESEALAVSYRFTAGGQTYQVGDFSTETGGSDGGQNEDKIVLKLIRPVQLRQPAPETGFNPAAWYLEMRNIYRLPSRDLQPTEFDLQIFYEPPGKTASKTLPGAGGTQTLLQLLGWDRVNADQALSPDNEFDFLVNYTIDPGKGLLVFPYLQPYGDRLVNVIEAGGGSEAAQAQLRDLLVFNALYREKKANARRDSQHDVYRMRGSYKGSVQSGYDLKAYAGVVEGSVRVTSGGTPLREGTDFHVEYSGNGYVEIINPAYLTSGRDIEIEFEQNSFFNVRKKTLLGMRAVYDNESWFTLGGTVMRLNEKTQIDKFRIGEEPVSNTIWGVDGAIDLEPRWMTRAIDAVPFLATREPSSISLKGEFAQLRPNTTETVAFDRTRKELRNVGRDFSGDELGGVSYIDDFEGFENTLTLTQPGTWSLSSAPDSVGAIDRMGVLSGTRSDSLRTNWRGNFGWYRVNVNTLREVPTIAYNPESIKIFRIDEVFPNRDTRAEIDPSLETLDVYFNPGERGPYNYTTNLGSLLNNPKDVWGGMTQRLPEGFSDFSLKNIDFVEFVFRPFAENPAEDAGRDAKLYFDLGSISEDVLPDEKLNNEDGLSTSTISEAGILKWGRSPSSTQNSVVDIDDATSRTEDLGLDGLASVASGAYPPFATEQVHFANFLNSLNTDSTDPQYRAEVAKAMVDPSGDDYHYFGNARYFDNTDFFPQQATFQQRFSRYFAGQELNAFEAQNKLADNTSVRRGNSRFPDSEDKNLNSTIDTENSYFQYEIPLSLSALDSLAAPNHVDDFIVGEIANAEGTGTGWYQVRIPVQQFNRKVGDIQDFTLIEFMRMWTTGHEVPITLRFASLELVGSQWQKSEQITLEHETAADTLNSETRLTISSINNEENADVYQPPIGAVVTQNRLPSGRVQNAREQSLVLRVEDLLPGKQRAIFKTQNTGLDLLKYSNLRMFVHMHGTLANGQEMASLPLEEGRSKARLFVRLGSNETNDYYEYEQPLTPSSETASSSDALWQTNVDYDGVLRDLGSMNIELRALNQLKVARDRIGFPTDSVFYNVKNGELTEPDAPNAEAFAPPGTRLAIKGTPSLSKVNSMVIGVRNAADSTETGMEYIIEDMSMWVNELRVAGYDSQSGWASVANAEFQLADFANVSASFKKQTDGFGSLSSTLGEREQLNINNWSVTTDVNTEKFLPERLGLDIPLNVQVTSQTSTPRFSPTRGDIRLEELISQIDEREDLSSEEKSAEKTAATEAAQTHSVTRSLTTSFRKNNSNNRILRNTLDGLTVRYTQSSTDARSPSLQVNDSWRWSTTMGYSFSGDPRTVRPFFFLEPIPILNKLGDLHFNYVPQTVSSTTSFSRTYTESQERPILAAGDTSSVPLAIRFPSREKHAFTLDRDFGLDYNPFGFLRLSYDTNTDLSLNAAGVDTLFSVVTADTSYAGIRLNQALSSGLIPEESAAGAFELASLELKPGFSVLGDYVHRAIDPRPESHGQAFTATLASPFARIKAMNWFRFNDLVYDVTYNWRNGPIGRNTGAAVQNTAQIRSGLSLKPVDLFKKFGFYRSIQEAQNQYIRDRQTARRNAQSGQDGAARPPVEKRSEDDPPPAAELAKAEKPSGPGFTGRLESFARQLLLAVTGVNDFTVTYQGTKVSTSSNVGKPVLNDGGQVVDVLTPYSLLDALRGNGPSAAYRFGFQRQFDLENRLIDPSLQVSDVLEDRHRFQGRTTLNPSKNFSINLNWNMEFSDNQTYAFRPLDDQDGNLIGIDTTLTQSGSNSVSTWAFGADYLEMFSNQLATFNQDFAATGEEDPAVIPDANMDGDVVLTNRSVVHDFRSAFLKGNSTLDSRNILPLPKPTWTIKYTGLSNWPLIRSLFSRFTVEHGYSSDYSADFQTNTAYLGADSIRTLDIGNRRIEYAVEEYNIGSIRINERYQPLIKFDMGWTGNISTTVQWDKSNSYSLSTSNFEVSENKTSSLEVTVGYTKSRIRLPLLGRTLNNRLTLNVSIQKSTTEDRRLRLRRALDQAIQDPEFLLEDALAGDNISQVAANNRLKITPRIGYQFSNRVSADFILVYEKFNSEDSRQPSYTNINGTFNISVSISN